MGSRLRSALASFTLAGVVVGVTTQLIPIVFPGVSRVMVNAITVVGAAITLIIGVLQFKAARDADGANVSSTVVRLPVEREERVSLAWVGATMAFVLLAMVTPVSLVLAVLTGLLAFRKRRVAAGFGMVLGGIASLVVLLFVLLPESSQSNDSQTATVCVTPFGITCPLPPGPKGVACYCGFYNGTSQ